MTKQQMEGRIAELEEENEDLQSRLESIIDIVQPSDEAADEDGDEMDGEDLDGRGDYRPEHLFTLKQSLAAYRDYRGLSPRRTRRFGTT